MKPTNIYVLSRNESLEITVFNAYYKSLVYKEDKAEIKAQDISVLQAFCDFVYEQSKNIAIFNDFYFCYMIPQISKEFDLLKIRNESILNIELKSDESNKDEIKQQLIKNKHYLKMLSKKLINITYTAKNKSFFILNDNDELEDISINEVITILTNFENCDPYNTNIDQLFQPDKYLISPINNPDEFLKNEYFLTNHQTQIKKKIIESFSKTSDSIYIKLTGHHGTGKTLLLYDLAKTFAAKDKALLIHCAGLPSKLMVLDEKIENLTIIQIKDLKKKNLSSFKYIFVDESHRMYLNQLQLLLNASAEYKTKIIFSIDPEQIIDKREIKANIYNHLNSDIGVIKHSLTDNIRTNKVIASFVKNLFDLSKKEKTSYRNVEIINCKNKNNVLSILDYYKNKNYQFISITTSLHTPHPIDMFESKINTHYVIGQEFDNVVMVIGPEFYYENNKLTADKHPYSNYLFPKLLFEGVTRARERLCLIVYNNEKLFKDIMSIFNN